VTEVWRTRKQRCDQAKLYDLETLVDPASALYRELVDYVIGVLDALGIAVGPSHTEVMVGPSGPVLIESAARVMGAMDISLISRATGTNAILLTAEAYLAPQRFLARFDQPRPPLECRVAMVQLLSQTHGTLTRWNLDALAALDTFHGIDTYPGPGDPVVPTVNSFTSPGLVFLAGPTDAALHRDYSRIRTLEAQGRLYEVDATSADPVGEEEEADALVGVGAPTANDGLRARTHA
jgi:L-amino acid ligase